MLLIPAENRLSKQNPPYLTGWLILLNIFAYIFIQGSDNDKFEKAYQSYYDNELLAKERKVFEEYAYRQRTDVYDLIIDNQVLPEEMLVGLILQDKQFAQHIQGLSNYSSEWREKRQQVNEHLNQTSTYQYAYYPSEPSLLTAFTHMFMHGGIGHLLGNMLFLFLFGYNLELLIGRLRTFATYLISGLGAVLFFAATTSDKFVPLVGASGAISGLMGGFAAFYGLKSIRYFYWIFVFFNYIRLPAFLVLIYWLLKELISASSSQDNVAYMAHFGGLLAGAASVYLIKLLPSKATNVKEFNDEIEENNISDNERKFHQAIQAQQELRFDEAKDLYYQLIQDDPYNQEYIARLYSIEKNTPQSIAFTELCQKILSLSLQSSSFDKLAQQAVIDLKIKAGGFQAITADTLIGYCKKSLRIKQVEPIKSIINFLVKEYHYHEQLPDLLLHFAFAQDEIRSYETKHKVLTYLAKKHQDTFAGQEAAKALKEMY